MVTYVSGRTSSLGVGGYDLCLVKFNITNGVEWNSTWGGIYDEFGEDIALDSLGNVYITGYTSSFGVGDMDVCLVKFNSTSDVKWYCGWGDIDDELGYGLIKDSLGHVYITGVRYVLETPGNSDVLLVKFIPGQCPVPEQQISGYNLILVLSITFIISILLIRKIKIK